VAAAAAPAAATEAAEITYGSRQLRVVVLASSIDGE